MIEIERLEQYSVAEVSERALSFSEYLIVCAPPSSGEDVR